jgi:hypothetical protein
MEAKRYAKEAKVGKCVRSQINTERPVAATSPVIPDLATSYFVSGWSLAHIIPLSESTM